MSDERRSVPWQRCASWSRSACPCWRRSGHVLAVIPEEAHRLPARAETAMILLD